MIVNVRSPYIVTINIGNQRGSKVELFIWNGTSSEPTIPTYTLSLNIPSNELPENEYNISTYLEEFIDNIKPVYSGNEDSNKMYVNFKFKRYYLNTSGVYNLLDTTTGIGLAGYTNYLDGVNFVSNANTELLADPAKEIIYNRSGQYPYINFVSKTDSISVVYADLNNGNISNSTITTTGNYKVYRVPVTTNSSAYDKGNFVTINGIKYTITPECGNKYTPVLCSFINRYGGWSFLTFLSNQTNSVDVKGSQYKLLPNTTSYDVYRGQMKSFNLNGNQTIKLNTGWVPENYSDLITELLLSETVLLDGKPVINKTKGSELKNYNNDKLINYEMEFTFAYDLINNVV